METEKKVLPVYFIRHKWNEHYDGNKVVDILEAEKRIAIHFNEEEKENLEDFSKESLSDPNFTSTFKIFKKISTDGAIVVANYKKTRCFIGEVKPSSKIEFFPESYGVRKGYKTLKLTNTFPVDYSDFPLLPIILPPYRTISRLKGNKEKFVRYIYCIEDLPFELKFLRPAIQEIMCTEWLRSEYCPEDFKLQYLLLGVGRTMEDIDIYGITIKGQELVAQVTFSEDNKKNKRKKERLREFSNKNFIKIFFSNEDNSQENDEIYNVTLQKVWDDFAKEEPRRTMLMKMLGKNDAKRRKTEHN